ncbi:MAG: polymerase gamma/tau subunit [Bacteroidetes bacterium]|nr:polymerase gamma/tau subunit [Bacteroidota bacterium]
MVDDELKMQLITLIKENRISHAQLYLSSAGAHSFALAIAFAQYLSCENPNETDSCGICPTCQKFEKLAHPDLHLIFPNCITKNVKKDPDSKQFAQQFREFVFQNNYHIDIDDWLKELDGENKQASINIRDCSNIINQNSIRSFEGGHKMYIIWCADRLYHAAAPKLLKTLEEPENKTLFILLTENSDKILTTILSRTQLVKIPQIKSDVIKKQLIEDYNISETKAEDIAAICEGNYHKAKTLATESTQLREMVSQFETLVKSIYSLSRKESNEQIGYPDVKEIINDIVAKGREEQKNFLKYLIRGFRNMLMMSTDNENLIRATADEKKIIQNYKDMVTLKNANAILNECNSAIYHIERNGNSGLVFTDLYLKLSQIVSPA